MTTATEAFFEQALTALEHVLTASELLAEWFEPRMLDHVPLQQLQPAIADVKQSFGAYQQVQQIGDTYCFSITWNNPAALELDKTLIHILCDAVVAIIQDLDSG